MGRSVYQFKVRDLNEAKDIAEKILQENKFVQKTLRSGEIVWRKGSALIASQQFVSIYYLKEEQLVRIYAWLQSGFGVPGMGEKEVERLGAIIPRRQLAKVIVQIEGEFEKIRL